MSTIYRANDGRFPEGSRVLIRFPINKLDQVPDRREDWPWLPGHVLGQCGPDEWHVVVDGVPDLAVAADVGTELLYPVCFRESSELSRPARSEAGS